MLCGLKLFLFSRLVGPAPRDFGSQLGRRLIAAETAVCIVALVLVVFAEELDVVFNRGVSADLLEVVGFRSLEEPEPDEPHELGHKDTYLEGGTDCVQDETHDVEICRVYSQGGKGEDCAGQIDEQEEEIDADDSAVSFPELEVGRNQADGNEDGGDDAEDEGRPCGPSLVDLSQRDDTADLEIDLEEHKEPRTEDDLLFWSGDRRVVHHLDVDDGAEEAEEVRLQHDWDGGVLDNDEDGEKGSAETPEDHHHFGEALGVLFSVIVVDLGDQLDAPAHCPDGRQDVCGCRDHVAMRNVDISHGKLLLACLGLITIAKESGSGAGCLSL